MSAPTPRHVNVGDGQRPRLLVYGNRWGLSQLPQLPREREWTFAETLDRLIEHGFAGVQAAADETAAVKAIQARGLRYCAANRVNTPVDVDRVLRLAADHNADCITLHVGWGMESDIEIDALVDAILELSARFDLPAYLETHRQTITQDLWRVTQLIARRPNVRFNGDFSHLYCGGELNYAGRFNESRGHLQPILERTNFLHGRISDGHCMQADVGEGDRSQNPAVDHFLWMWTEVMTHWLRRAAPGDVLPFAPELGPPSSRYSITYRDGAGQLCELSDRWQQTLVLKRLAEEAFAEAKRLVPSPSGRGLG